MIDTQKSLNPIIYKVNPEGWLSDISTKINMPAFLDDIPDEDLKLLSLHGIDWIWLDDVWHHKQVNKLDFPLSPNWQSKLPEGDPEAISKFMKVDLYSLIQFNVKNGLDGDEALHQFRKRLSKYGLKLMLDFVPDRKKSHLEIIVNKSNGISAQRYDAQSKHNIDRDHTKTWSDNKIDNRLFFPDWPASSKLDYNNPLIESCIEQCVEKISGQCDGIGWDFSLLINPEENERNWINRTSKSLSELVKKVHLRHSEFCMLSMHNGKIDQAFRQIGFDYVVDKHLYELSGINNDLNLN